MEGIAIYWDREGNTLNVWFDDPGKEATCEETGDEVVLVKDATGRVIGFEKLNFRVAGEALQGERLPVEVKVA